MKVTIEEAKGFYTDADAYRRDWLEVAKRSWDEIKRQGPGTKNGSAGLTGKRKKKYPAWYSIFKIRQPLVLSRIGIPIGKDTTEAGDDSVGATAALLKERLAKNLVKTFDFFDVLCAARDDFLVTNFGQVRAYYERDEVKERVKDRIQPQPMPDGSSQFFDSMGELVLDDDVFEDDEGFFVYTNQVVDVENERVCLEPMLYEHVRIDPQCRRWNRCKRQSFDLFFSKPEFVEIFGKEAYRNLAQAEREKNEQAWDKCQTIKVVEYWDEYSKETLWWAENGGEFITPKGYFIPDGDMDDADDVAELAVQNGIYDLPKFFPTPPPLMMNSPTDEFWPIPEYHQLVDVLDEIHTLFGRMVSTTKAIRARLLFDNNVDGLQAALHEATDGDAFGVPNLGQALAGAGGSLDAVTQYINVAPLIESLGSMYQALDQRLNMLYRLTGTSDLLQGLQQDQSRDRTLGESQLLEKYALNQFAEPQRKMAEFVRDCYELMTEIALKNFKDSSLDIYLIPATLTEDHKSRYRAAIGLLRDNSKHFRIELETDSTIAINENYDKAMRAELVQIMTDSIERVAGIAQGNPALTAITLHALKYLVQGHRQGKMFQAEITAAIDNVIKQTEEAAQNAEPQFDAEKAKIELEQSKMTQSAQIEVAKMQQEGQLRTLQMQSQERIESIRLQQEAALTNLQAQIDSFKIQSDSAAAQTQTQLDYEKIRAEISTAQEELALKRDALMVEMQKAAGEQSIAEFKAMLEQQASAFDAELKSRQQALDERLGMMDEQEKLMTEARLQQEHELEKVRTRVETLASIKEAMKPPEMPPITVNVESPKPKKAKKRIKIERDENGSPISFEAEDSEE